MKEFSKVGGVITIAVELLVLTLSVAIPVFVSGYNHTVLAIGITVGLGIVLVLEVYRKHINFEKQRAADRLQRITVRELHTALVNELERILDDPAEAEHHDRAARTLLQINGLSEDAILEIKNELIKTGSLRFQRRTSGPRTPQLANYLLYFLPPRIGDALVGDLEEKYHRLYKQFGKRRADVWYYWQVFISFGPIIYSFFKRVVAIRVLHWVGDFIGRLIS